MVIKRVIGVKIIDSGKILDELSDRCWKRAPRYWVEDSEVWERTRHARASLFARVVA